jgi:hypothetical protein
MAERTEMSEHLQSALASRAVIDQALGVVMGQNRCTADETFDILRMNSQNRNVKLRDVRSRYLRGQRTIARHRSTVHLRARGAIVRSVCGARLHRVVRGAG